MGDIFHHFGQFFKVYTAYTSNFTESATLVGIIRAERSKVDAVFRQSEEDPRCKMLNCQSLMITVVQRVPRYKLLLQELLKRTPESHPDHPWIVRGLRTISAVADYINKDIKRLENQVKIYGVQHSLTGTHQSSRKIPELAAPGRTFIREGGLSKVDRRGNSTPYHVWLFNDLLMYGKSKSKGDKSKGAGGASAAA